MFLIVTECFEKFKKYQIQQEKLSDKQIWDNQTNVLESMKKQQQQKNFMQNCQYNEKIQKCLSHNIRNIIYSFLSLKQFYIIMNKLQKSEKASSHHQMNNRLQRGEEFLIYPEMFGNILDLDFMKTYTISYTIIFRQSINQSQIRKVLHFLKTLSKHSFGINKPQINTEIIQCQVDNDIFINQILEYPKIYFNKLSIINSEFSFSNSNLRPFLNLFPKVHLKDSHIEQLQSNETRNYITCQYFFKYPTLQFYNNLKELRMENCVFVDSKMLESTINLEFLIIQNSHLNISSQNILICGNNTKLLKQAEFTFNKQKLNILNQDFILDQTELCLFSLKFLGQNIQKLERIQYDIYNAKFQQFLINANELTYRDTISRLQNYIDLNIVFNELKSNNRPIELHAKITNLNENFEHLIKYFDFQTKSMIIEWLNDNDTSFVFEDNEKQIHEKILQELTAGIDYYINQVNNQ